MFKTSFRSCNHQKRLSLSRLINEYAINSTSKCVGQTFVEKRCTLLDYLLSINKVFLPKRGHTYILMIETSPCLDIFNFLLDVADVNDYVVVLQIQKLFF